MGQCTAKENQQIKPLYVKKHSIPPATLMKKGSESLLKEHRDVTCNILKVGAVVQLPLSSDDRLRRVTSKMNHSWPKMGVVHTLRKNTVVIKITTTTTMEFPLATFPSHTERLCPEGCKLKLSILPATCTVCGTTATHVQWCSTHSHVLCSYCTGKPYLPAVGSKIVSGPTMNNKERPKTEEGLVLTHPKHTSGSFTVLWDNGDKEDVRGPPYQDIVTVVGRAPKEMYSAEKGFTFNQIAENVGEKSVKILEPTTVVTREVVSSSDCHEFRVVLDGATTAVAVVEEDSFGITESGITMMSSEDTGVSFLQDGELIQELPSEKLPANTEVVVKIVKNTAEFSWREGRNPECFNLPRGNFRFGVHLGQSGSSAFIRDAWKPPVYKWADIDVNLSDPKNILGQGAHGIVYRARLNCEMVAVKVLKKTLQNKEEQYKKEVAALSATNNMPHNLKLLGVVPGLCGIITELCDKTLKEHILESGENGLKLNDATRIAHEVCTGMRAIEEAGMVHCDLNCSNIFIRDGHAVVGDYGLTLPVSMVKGRRGSLMYMAPEVFNGKKNSVRSDVFAMGMVLYFLFTGREPKPADYDEAPPPSAHLASLAIRGRSAQVASGVTYGIRPRIPTTLPAVVANVIESCWTSSPSKRPSFSQIENRLPCDENE
eukprot:TRINITY_DN1833_c1_g1_i1.p1 TRINITY_DN1833_c1_g1~~TRINITY_DN1833_c1_g1_i1.p1  ORF type:complete len:674 (+),score=100.47 TRINITY_DN1833_c1_g1_i1:53-2023(+)